MNHVIITLYVLTVPLANWLISHVGLQPAPGAPHLVPVGFGLMAPSGVLVIGAAMVLRDAIQWRMGGWVAGAAIFAGAAISLLSGAQAGLAFAAALAFLASELADAGTFTLFRRLGVGAAVLASGVAGSLVDSILFLLLAFGSLDFLAGQVVGKLWASLVAAGLLGIIRAARGGRRPI